MNTMNSDILLIDDEPDLRECIADLLEGEGYKVAQAENGRTALDLLKSGQTPRVILLDYMDVAAQLEKPLNIQKFLEVVKSFCKI